MPQRVEPLDKLGQLGHRADHQRVLPRLAQEVLGAVTLPKRAELDPEAACRDGGRTAPFAGRLSGGPLTAAWRRREMRKMLQARGVTAPILWLLRPHQVDQIGEHGEKLRLIPYGIPLERFAAARPAQTDGRSGAGRLLFVGRLRHYKGLDYLIRALPGIGGAIQELGAADPVQDGGREFPWQDCLGRRVRDLGGDGGTLSACGLAAGERGRVRGRCSGDVGNFSTCRLVADDRRSGTGGPTAPSMASHARAS